ncbi:formyltransferase family protein [Alphaproteobacteria bacterium]|nr:formyltransferase family protein [Alphaproteobacteria bacterium]
MRIAVLTTITSHHAYFLKKLISHGHEVRAFIETKKRKKYKFKTIHKIDSDTEKFEHKIWFNGLKPNINKICINYKSSNINNVSIEKKISEYNPELIFVFGTGKIGTQIINNHNNIIYNFHGGHPEYYRGLDTNLWAIYHNQFKMLTTCLHKLDKKFDNGNIFKLKKIKITKSMKIEEIRSKNTLLCVKLATELIKMYSTKKKIVLKKQKGKGRFYSAMPAILKEECKLNFDKYTLRLK